jgi:alkanesulfonate monooxygenase SsuD/methylene tetrahydromethanopterin reductase-like flavin-dependent oxidoreductase (luciferase family)
MPAPVRFGYLCDFRNPPAWAKPWHRHYDEMLEFLAWTETIGFGHVVFAEHHGVVEDGYNPSPLMALMALATKTRTMRLSTGIALAPFYHPVRMAEDAAILDIVSNGRLELAVAVGFRKVEAEAYGFDFKTRGRRVDEMVQIMSRLLRGETLTFEGEFYQLRNCTLAPMGIQSPIPLLIGGVTPPAMRRAAQWGDGFLGPIEHYGTYEKYLSEFGKDPSKMRVGTMGSDDIYIVVSDDPEKTFHEVAPHMYWNYNSYAKMWAAETSDFVGTVRADANQQDLEAFKKSGAFRVLTPDEMIAHVRARRELGPFQTYSLMLPPGYPLEKMAEHAQLFADKVLPAFQA